MAATIESSEDSQSSDRDLIYFNLDQTYGEFLDQMEAGTADPRDVEWCQKFARKLVDHIARFTPVK